MDDPLLAELQQTLQREMPICMAMGIEVVSCGKEQLVMRMPLEPNRNHQYSAFAGSLNALCTIVGWGTVFLLLKQENLTGNIVIRRGAIRYSRPVRTSEIVATGMALDTDHVGYFFELLRSKGRSKVEVAVEIADADGPCVKFKGSYVVQD